MVATLETMRQNFLLSSSSHSDVGSRRFTMLEVSRLLSIMHGFNLPPSPLPVCMQQTDESAYQEQRFAPQQEGRPMLPVTAA